MRVFLAAAAVLAVAVAGAAARSDQGKLIDTLAVDFKDGTPVTSKVRLARDVPFVIVVSGLGTRTSKFGTDQCDALYCIARDSGTPISRENLALKTENVGDWQGLDRFAGKSRGDIPYSPSHTYTISMKELSTVQRLQVRSNFAHYLGCSESSGSTCSGAFTVKIYWPGGPQDGGENEATGCKKSYRAPASRAAINEVRVVACKEEVEWRRGNGEWQDVKRNDILRQGDEISTDPDGSITLAFADNSTITLRNVTQLKIASFFTEGGVVRTELLLRQGEISAKVNKSETTRSDFKIKPPGPGGSVRGTEFTVFADPGSRASIWSVKSGSVRVGSTTVGAGKAVEATSAGIGAVTVLGGLSRAKATALVLRTVARFDDACGLATLRAGATAAKPAGGAWLVTVKVTGKVRGASTWRAAGTRATPQNALATKIAGGCKGGSSTTPGTQTTQPTSAQAALAVVERMIREAAAACQITAWRIRASGTTASWKVTATVTRAGVEQTAEWEIAGGKVVARNALAQQISARCS